MPPIGMISIWLLHGFISGPLPICKLGNYSELNCSCSSDLNSCLLRGLILNFVWLLPRPKPCTAVWKCLLDIVKLAFCSNGVKFLATFLEVPPPLPSRLPISRRSGLAEPAPSPASFKMKVGLCRLSLAERSIYNLSFSFCSLVSTADWRRCCMVDDGGIGENVPMLF